ncbi:MAG: nucleotidyl transferase AbiEii/AbiGii toxin family protein [Polyangiaceae bacterium]
MGKPTGVAAKQLRALDRLKTLAPLAGFYLAGGTAIAFHLRHRRSLDLDLFSATADVDFDVIRRSLAVLPEGVSVIAETDAALKVLLLGEPVDLVRYPYAPLEHPTAGPSGFPVAGLLDLAVMKMAAVARRGIRRDFWDLRVLLGTGLTLGVAGEAYLQRFGVNESDLYHVARALTYFADAEKDPAFPAGMTMESWSEIQRFFEAEAPKLLPR